MKVSLPINMLNDDDASTSIRYWLLANTSTVTGCLFPPKGNSIKSVTKKDRDDIRVITLH